MTRLTEMARQPLPPIAAVISFIDGINRGDLEGLVRLMTDDHMLVVLDEAPLVGRAQNRDAWKGYFSSFPEYVIYPRHLTANGASVATRTSRTSERVTRCRPVAAR